MRTSQRTGRSAVTSARLRVFREQAHVKSCEAALRHHVECLRRGDRRPETIRTAGDAIVVLEMMTDRHVAEGGYLNPGVRQRREQLIAGARAAIAETERPRRAVNWFRLSLITAFAVPASIGMYLGAQPDYPYPNEVVLIGLLAGVLVAYAQACCCGGGGAWPDL